jgi:hypothetical protein
VPEVTLCHSETVKCALSKLAIWDGRWHRCLNPLVSRRSSVFATAFQLQKWIDHANVLALLTSFAVLHCPMPSSQSQLDYVRVMHKRLRAGFFPMVSASTLLPAIFGTPVASKQSHVHRPHRRGVHRLCSRASSVPTWIQHSRLSTSSSGLASLIDP